MRRTWLHVDDGEVTQGRAVVPKGLQVLVTQYLFCRHCRFDLADTSDGALDDVALVFEPGKEAGHDAPNVIDGHLARATVRFVVAEVFAQVVAADLGIWLPD